MVFLHVLGSGATRAEQANNKGHLFERLMVGLLEHLKMKVERINKSENGLEIDIEGVSVLGEVPFFAECKAQEDPLGSSEVQQFGFKFLDKLQDNADTRGFLFSLSPLGGKGREVWDAKLRAKHGPHVNSYISTEIVSLLIEHYGLASAESVRQDASRRSGRAPGDIQLLCVEGGDGRPSLYWAQVLMSSDGAVPSHLLLYGRDGSPIEDGMTVQRLLDIKPDLRKSRLVCLNLEPQPSTSTPFDDFTTSRAVVRVRMGKSWFDYRFPAAPAFFVGRNPQRGELAKFVMDVREGRTSARGLIFSGTSGIGKSSLALKARDELMSDKVVLLPIDCRLCDDMAFLFDSVNELVLEMRQVPALSPGLQLVTVQGLDSLIETLTAVDHVLSEHGYLAVLFFDQFEKVFEYADVTRAIRTLFLRVTERQLSVLFGFAWKSDLWSLAEGFPHHERDDIVREAYSVRQLGQFGQEETAEILKHLEAQWGGKLSTQLHKQLAMFSRGLPWLLKKVCAHLLDQRERGVTESELIEANLKLQDLFESDLGGLDDEERALLRAIAPLLPTTLRRLSESFEISSIDKSLYRFIDKRILVKITEDVTESQGNVKYDAYSDIFREFLVTGIVPIDDAYYFYTYPAGALRFFEKVRQRGTLTIEQEIAETGRQMPSIYNLSRDLRSLGLVNVRNKVFTLTEEVMDRGLPDIVAFLQVQLKRNRIVGLILAELNEVGAAPLGRIAELLQELFPSVRAKDDTWDFYSKTMASWLHEARLAFFDRRRKSLHRADDEAAFEAVVERSRLSSAGFRCPMCFRNGVVGCLEQLGADGDRSTLLELAAAMYLSHQSIEKSLSDNMNLGFVSSVGGGVYQVTSIGAQFIASSESERRGIFREQCLSFPIFSTFIQRAREAGPQAFSAKEVVDRLVRELQLPLADATVDKLTAILVNWAEYAGLLARSGRLCLMAENAPRQIALL